MKLTYTNRFYRDELDSNAFFNIALKHHLRSVTQPAIRFLLSDHHLAFISLHCRYPIVSMKGVKSLASYNKYIV